MSLARLVGWAMLYLGIVGFIGWISVVWVSTESLAIPVDQIANVNLPQQEIVLEDGVKITRVHDVKFSKGKVVISRERISARVQLAVALVCIALAVAGSIIVLS